MMKWIICTSIALFAMVLSGRAQGNVLSLEANLANDSDVISSQIVQYFNTEVGGNNAIWNLSDIHSELRPYIIRFQRDTIGRYIAITDHDISYYELHNNMLSLVSQENPLNKLNFSQPILCMNFPLTYGDSISVPFSGNGVYCGDHPFREQGISTIIADAKGSIVIDNDTIPNVLRVYSLKSYSICMDIDSAALDTARLKQVIEERYDWYARGYRYPLFTAITSTSYDATKVIGTSQKAYCMLPESQRLQNDPYNQTIRNKDSLSLAERNNVDEEIFHYTIGQNGNQFTINYSLDKDADITILVSDVMGVAYKRSHYHSSKGEDYSVNIDCTGLRYGQYVLYMNVNGKIYSDNITIKP